MPARASRRSTAPLWERLGDLSGASLSRLGGAVLVGAALLTILVLLPWLPSPRALSALGIAEQTTTAAPAPAETPATETDKQTAAQAAALSSPRATPAPTARVWMSASGVPASDAVSDGTWSVAPALQPDGPAHTTTHRYLLKVEGGTGVNAAEAGHTINAILNDPRGWATVDDVSFEQVSDPAAAEFTIHLATPTTTDALCAPLDTSGEWSCRNGATVNLNSDRWNYLVPWFPDADTYRAYLINHEVGHWLGRGHEYCAGPGLKAPLMMQQSGGVGPCVPNSWPTEDGQPG